MRDFVELLLIIIATLGLVLMPSIAAILLKHPSAGRILRANIFMPVATYLIFALSIKEVVAGVYIPRTLPMQLLVRDIAGYYSGIIMVFAPVMSLALWIYGIYHVLFGISLKERKHLNLLRKAAQIANNNQGIDLTNMTREERRKALFG